MGFINVAGYNPDHFSHSTVDTWIQCPKKFQLRKVLQVEERPMFAGVGGTAVHAATEDFDRAVHSGAEKLPPSGMMVTIAQDETGASDEHVHGTV